MKTIDNFVKDGWKLIEPIEDYKGYIIYGKGNKRILYCPKGNRIVIRYELHKVDILKEKK